ncbi:MAG: hypothetical protein Q7V63_08055 [Gammaproteobacteria bacterium]|nr:hypothetical protein [Gammaproteobacteria bacterium]
MQLGNYQKPRLPLAIKFIALSLSLSFLSGCAPAPPQNMSNICSIFQQYPKWYWEALDSYKQWGVPVSVQLAIVHAESHFQPGARPPRTTLLGFIPWTRPTSAYGYAQAVDGTWLNYQTQTSRHSADRDEFGDATDFIGWYGYTANKKLGISKRNAYQLYLAYHEGINGYAAGTYRDKPWLITIAQNVQYQATAYRKQLHYCKYSIPKPSLWNLWLM